MMPVYKAAVAIKSYQSQAEVLLKEYILADPLIPYTSIIGGIIACKTIYDLSQLISAVYFKSYSSLSRIQRIEWNNRALSTVHAVYITIMSLYFVFWSDLFSDHLHGLITFRSSLLSTFSLGVSVGYFLADLGMIFWLYPSLGGMEYVVHHLLSMAALAYAMLTGEGQIYTYMVLISETTTPGINLRWYLDNAGMKRSRAYLFNGVVIFIAWLVARVLLFMYLFYHVYLHYDQAANILALYAWLNESQFNATLSETCLLNVYLTYEEVREIHSFGLFLVFVVPYVLAVMNLMWFGKIIKGLKKTLAKRQ